MTKAEMSALILEAKKKSGMSWSDLEGKLGMGKVYIASCCFGENSMDATAAKALGEALSLSAEVVEELQAFPMKGWTHEKKVPTDPFIYRFYEIMAVYGACTKDVAQEMFGDGIMSAIDFKLDVTKEEDPKGDRVVITMNGKFLPYKRW